MENGGGGRTGIGRVRVVLGRENIIPKVLRQERVWQVEGLIVAVTEVSKMRTRE